VWTSKILGKLFLVYAGLGVVLTVAFVASLFTWQRGAAVEQMTQALELTATGLIKSAAADNPADGRAALIREVEAAQRDERHSLVLVDEFGHVIAGAAGQENLSADPEIQSALAGEAAHAEQSYDYGSLLHVAVPVRHGQTVVGALRISQDLVVIDRPMARTSRMLAALGIGAALIACVVTYFIVARIVRPLAELTQGAQDLADDDQEGPLLLVVATS
jgi:hypothetical protein